MRGDRRGIRWLLMPMVLVATLAISYGAYRLAGWSWDQVVSYRSPYASPEIPETAADGESGSRLVLVIVDGLRSDVSQRFLSMERLRDRGADLTLVAGQPSLSFPTWTTILSGAPQHVTGVTTNWFEERVPVETIIDTALSSGRTVGVVGPSSFETLYGVKRAQHVSLMDWDDEYLSGRLVDEALRIEAEGKPDLLVVHLPDVDEAGHESGGASEEYAKVAARVDSEIVRLVEGTQDPQTTYAIVADHGHIDSGGHGGWEDDVVLTPAVIAGPEVVSDERIATQSSLAPTLALLMGIPVPRHAMSEPLTDVLVTSRSGREIVSQRLPMADHYVATVGEGAARIDQRSDGTFDADSVDETIRQTEDAREARERLLRLREGLPVAIAALVAIGLVGMASRIALSAGLAGALAYHAVYNGAYFLLHGHQWSLSAFNSETKIDAFFSARMLETAIAGVAAAAVAGLAYGLLRREPYPPRGRFLPGWLVLGPVTVLLVQATLALQVAWFLWWWGASVTWRMPDFMWAFKYDLDLIQTTALGAAAVLSPLVTFVIGRYHPKVRRAEGARAAALVGDEDEAAEEEASAIPR